MIKGRAASVILFLALVVPLGWSSASRLRDDVKSAIRLRHEPWAARQRVVYGEWFGVAQQLEASLPANEPVDIIMTAPNAWGVAVFTGAALAPRPCRFFLGEDNWRGRVRAPFVHDPRGVNAPPGPPPLPASIVLIAEENALRIRQ
jgi:hypothetical protein